MHYVTPSTQTWTVSRLLRDGWMYPARHTSAFTMSPFRTAERLERMGAAMKKSATRWMWNKPLIQTRLAPRFCRLSGKTPILIQRRKRFITLGSLKYRHRDGRPTMQSFSGLSVRQTCLDLSRSAPTPHRSGTTRNQSRS